MHKTGQAFKDHRFTGCYKILVICVKKNQYYLLIGKKSGLFSKTAYLLHLIGSR